MRSHLAVVLAVFIVGATASTARATPLPDTSADIPDPVVSSTATVTVDGQVVQSAVPAASGSGGTSSARGCRTVRVTNVGHTSLHLVAYKFWTEQGWCWNHGLGSVFNLTHDWGICCMRRTFHWQGIVPDTTRFAFYAWMGALYPHSGHYYKKTGEFENCVFKYGCIGTTYPHNEIFGHADGTYKWSKTGAG